MESPGDVCWESEEIKREVKVPVFFHESVGWLNIDPSVSFPSSCRLESSFLGSSRPCGTNTNKRPPPVTAHIPLKK